MELIISFLTHSLLILVALHFYEKVVKINIKVLALAVIAIPFIFYMTASVEHVSEPFRMLGGFIILLAALLIVRKFTQHIFLTSFVAALFFAYSLRLMTSIIVAAFVAIFDIELGLLFHVTLVLVEGISYFIFYKSLKLKDGLPELEEEGFKFGVWAIAGISVILQSGVIVFAGIVEDENHTLFWGTFGFLLLIFVLFVISITVFIRHIVKRRHEKAELEQEKQKIKEKLQKLEANLHKEKSKKSIINMAYKGLVNEVPLLIGKTDSAQIKKINNYIEAINEFAPELTEDHSVGTDAHVRSLGIPDEWIEVKLLVTSMMTLAREKGITILVNSKVKNWKLIPISRKDFVCLLGNLLENAIKETAKVKSGHKEVHLQIYDDKDEFTIDVTDSAHEFELDILKNLGVRGNSTNGTGHGYVEILEIIHQVDASLLIKEWPTSTAYAKSICVVFDEMGEISIGSNYRRDTLKAVLTDSILKVL